MPAPRASSTPKAFSRLELSLGVLALAAHFAPEDGLDRAAALLHDVGHLPLSHTFEGVAGLDHHAIKESCLPCQNCLYHYRDYG